MKEFLEINFYGIPYVILIAGFALTCVLGPIFIPFLHKLKFGQTVREDGPQTHLKKTGTPTIGGLIFLIPILVIGIPLCMVYNEVIPLLIATVGFGFVGFIDDYLKVVKKSKDGLSIKQKTFVILVVSIIFAVYVGWFTDIGIDINIPFIGVLQMNEWVRAAFYLVFVLVYLYATTNTVNFADGLDGLLSGLMVIVMIAMICVTYIIPGYEGVREFATLVMSGCLGFLLFNAHPAKVFMGDTGSLALGGAFAAMLLMLKMPFMVFVFGLIFVIEGLSVAIQVFSFKKFGKRVFKMAPIHHHFEVLGWKETKVVAVFWTFTMVTAMVGIAIIKYFG